MTALARPRTIPQIRPSAEPANRVVLHGVDWQTYCTVADSFPERPIRITYDRGAMEIMTVSNAHERYKSLMSLMVLAMAEVFRRNFGCFGSFTHRRKDLERALEPDLCFYFRNFGVVRGKRKIDLEKDPPPDLAIEIEISRSALNRMGIYAALGVPELWRFEGDVLQVYVLVKGSYEMRDGSLAFPEVPVCDLVRFLPVGIDEGDLAMMAAVRKWAAKFKKTRNGK